MVNLSPTLAPSLLSASLGQAAGEARVSNLFARLSESLRTDEATLRRLENLIRPANETGTRGSYAGWIARSAIRAAAAQGDVPALESLLVFFRGGGSLRKLETLAARVLPDAPEKSEIERAGVWVPPPFQQRLIALTSPLGEWRRARWARIAASEDPLKFSKLAEMNDWRFRLRGAETPASSWLGGGRREAYLRNRDLRSLAELIELEAPDLIEEKGAHERYKETQRRIKDVLGDHPAGAPFWRLQVIQGLRALGDDVSLAAADGIEREYSLSIQLDTKFKECVEERHAREGRTVFADPAHQSAVYFPKNPHGERVLYIRSRPLGLPKGLDAVDVFFHLLAIVIHEHDHHARLGALGYRNKPGENFAFELSAHGVEYLWRARRGSPVHLRRMFAENPLGFALAFRDEYEIVYPRAAHSPSV